MARGARSSFRLAAAAVVGILVCVAAVRMHGGRGQITAVRITFPNPSAGSDLSGVIYKPLAYNAALRSHYSAVVMMHGCSGMWSERTVGATNADGSPNLQNNIEKWGIKLAENNVIALAVDSFTPRQPPDAISSKEWQYQCNESAGRYAGAVNPYTDRVLDARAAWEHLDAIPEIDGSRIGLLGWSHGAQGVMVESAVTSREINVPRVESDHKFACCVAFYPGCGENLGFGKTISRSFWRPFRPMQLHIGDCDNFYDNCLTRRNLAVTRYSKPVLFHAYHGARHHFDAFSLAWPSFTCNEFPKDDDYCSKSEGPDGGDQCAMRAADIAALDFFLSVLT